MKPLGPKQQAIYNFIKSYIEEHRLSPTYEEIRQGMGLKSLGSVYDYIVSLLDKGYLKKNGKGGRCLVLQEKIPPRKKVFELPLLGRVAAGVPLEVMDDLDDRVNVPDFLVGKGEHYVLKVEGHSMQEECILDGDYLVVKKTSIARSGEKVIALVDGGATVKTFYKNRRGIELRPANKDYESLWIKSENFYIQGLVVGVIRNYL